MFAQLRERLVESKCEECTLNIAKIYSVFGRTQSRETFEEARITDVSVRTGSVTEACLLRHTITPRAHPRDHSCTLRADTSPRTPPLHLQIPPLTSWTLRATPTHHECVLFIISALLFFFYIFQENAGCWGCFREGVISNKNAGTSAVLYNNNIRALDM